MQKILILLGILGVGFFLIQGFSFFRPNESNKEAIDTNDGMVFEPTEPYYKMKESERKVFLSKVKTLKLGDPYSKVIQLLGKPDYEVEIIGKEANAKVRGYIADYYLLRWHNEFVNNNDHLVMVIFDLDKKLFAIELTFSDEYSINKDKYL